MVKFTPFFGLINKLFVYITYPFLANSGDKKTPFFNVATGFLVELENDSYDKYFRGQKIMDGLPARIRGHETIKWLGQGSDGF